MPQKIFFSHKQTNDQFGVEGVGGRERFMDKTRRMMK